MHREPGDEALLPARGAVLIEEFCRATGLGQNVVQRLMRSEQLEGGLWKDEERTRPFGILDDALPSRSALIALGLPVRDDYDPESLRPDE